MIDPEHLSRMYEWLHREGYASAANMLERIVRAHNATEHPAYAPLSAPVFTDSAIVTLAFHQQEMRRVETERDQLRKALKASHRELANAREYWTDQALGKAREVVRAVHGGMKDDTENGV
jgi:hypothetical protein